ncbi:cysteine desulfurase family protein [Rossellomorea sp. y25]|uniref:cysteine desulfurase family protein n=1 Tax=Rossellomorea sp. y25 TaxID=3118174 RepID=UPI0026114C54|nr:cysteine desulfurase family protein [uncultured Rossellomorea sp.]
MIYFDNSATTFVDDNILKEFVHVSTAYPGNPSSSHRLGQAASLMLEKARARAVEALGGESGEVIFTSGGTESNTLAVKGAAYANRQKGHHIITTSIEHASVYETCRQLEQEGFTVSYLPVDSHGMIHLEDLKREICPETILISIMGVNNEVGSIQPIEEVATLLAKYPDILFHVDFVQGFGKISLDMSRIDLLSLSGHKLHAPKGTGLLYVKDGTNLFPVQAGGGQERALRSGTENLAGSVALSLAMEKQVLRFEESVNHLTSLRNHLIQGLRMIPGVTIHSPENGAPHIVHFSTKGTNSRDVMEQLGQEEIYVSNGSACSSKSGKPSRVLSAAGIQEENAAGAIRVSFSIHNTLEEVDQLLMCFIRICQKDIFV